MVDGEKCQQCDGEGSFELPGCPREFVGGRITEAVNVAGLCSGGIMPIEGGLLSQSAWFVSLWQTLKSEEAQIDAERAKRNNYG